MLWKHQSLTGELPIVQYIWIVFVALMVIWLFQYHWGRRRLYSISATRKCAPTLPIIGHAHYFLGSNQEILENFLKIVDPYESPVPIWLGQKLIIAINKPEDLEAIMKSPNSLNKGDLYKFVEFTVGHGLLTAPVDTWRKHRKIIAPTFNQKLLDTFVKVFVRQSDILMTQLEKRAGGDELKIFHPIARFTLDALCETIMGVTVNAQTTEFKFSRWVNRALELYFQRMLAVFYHFDFIFHRTRIYTELKYLNQNIHEFTDKVIKDKIQDYEKRQRDNKENPEFYFDHDENFRMTTFLEQLIKFSFSKGELTFRGLRDEVISTMIAGTDTAASTMSFTMILLGMHPEIQENAYQEVLQVLGTDCSVEAEKLPKLQYLEMLLKESMRLFPPLPLSLRVIKSDIRLSGDFIIPEGSNVVMSILQTHRNAAIWPDPMRFDPLRFLPEECAKRHPYSYLPFSGGPRNCIGQKYAMMLMKIVIASTLRKFKISSDYERVEDIKVKADIILKAVDGFKIKLEKRDNF